MIGSIIWIPLQYISIVPPKMDVGDKNVATVDNTKGMTPKLRLLIKKSFVFFSFLVFHTLYNPIAAENIITEPITT